MRTAISNEHLPGVTAERTLALDNENARDQIFDRGDYVGEIVYVRRRHAGGGSTYGWRRARAAAQSRLMTRLEAVMQLLGEAS